MPTNQITDLRRVGRRAPKHGTIVTCLKGVLGLGPDLAIRLDDLSEDGARLLVNAQLPVGEEIELNFTPPGMNKPIIVLAVVAWCIASNDQIGFRLGATFRSSLSYQDMFNLV